MGLLYIDFLVIIGSSLWSASLEILLLVPTWHCFCYLGVRRWLFGAIFRIGRLNGTEQVEICISRNC